MKGQTDDHNHNHNHTIASTTSSPRTEIAVISVKSQCVALPPAQSITPNPSLCLVACIARQTPLRLLCITSPRTPRLVVRTEDHIQIHSPTAAARSRQTPPTTLRRHEVDQPLPVRPNTGGEGPRMAAEAEAARTDARPGGAQRESGLTVTLGSIVPLTASLRFDAPASHHTWFCSH